MSWWSRLLGGSSETASKPKRLDYLGEAMALERTGDYDAALTSYRLALREHPTDTKILQNMAIAFTRTNQPEEAIRSYKRALDADPELSGAHYGLAFLLLKRGDRAGAEKHLDAFLSKPPSGAESQRWIRHAEETLDQLRGEAPADGSEP
jgi:tetratricopeptide (TPR) repeat protein